MFCARPWDLGFDAEDWNGSGTDHELGGAAQQQSVESAPAMSAQSDGVDVQILDDFLDSAIGPTHGDHAVYVDGVLAVPITKLLKQGKSFFLKIGNELRDRSHPCRVLSDKLMVFDDM